MSSSPAMAMPTLALDVDLVAAQPGRASASRCVEALGQHGVPVGGRHVLDQDRELVAAQPGDGVGRAGAGLEPLRRRDQQPVALASGPGCR